MAATGLTITSLRQALLEAMRAPTARRVVTVVSVHVGQAAPLLSLFRLQASGDGDPPHWELQNVTRLASLVSLDSLLRAIATGILPLLIADPASRPALRLLLSRYARYVKASASTVGGDFAEYAMPICDYMIGLAEAGSRPQQQPLPEPEMLRRAKEALRRLHVLRSRQVFLADYNSDSGSDSDSDSDSEADDAAALEISVTSLRGALQEVIAAPAAGRRVTIDGLRLSDSAALLGMVRFQTTAASWEVRNLRRLATITSVDACFQALTRGLLRILSADPTSTAALALLSRYALYIMESAGMAGGEFLQYATGICDQLHAHATTGSRAPALLTASHMLENTCQLRQGLAAIRSEKLAIDSTSEAGFDISTSSSDTSASGFDISASEAGSNMSTNASASDSDISIADCT